MSRDNFETLVPGLRELRARERENRALGFAGITRTVCGEELASLTPGTRLELQLLRNAFTIPGVEPLDGDVFLFLWITNARRTRVPVVSSFRQWRLRRRVKKLHLAAAVREIRSYMVDQLQDLPEASGEGADLSPWVFWMASEASWWLSTHGGFTLEAYLRTPYIVLQQLYRGFRMNNPVVAYDARGNAIVEEPQFINASDRLVGEFHAQHRAAAAAAIRSRRTRLS